MTILTSSLPKISLFHGETMDHSHMSLTNLPVVSLVLCFWKKWKRAYQKHTDSRLIEKNSNQNSHDRVIYKIILGKEILFFVGKVFLF